MGTGLRSRNGEDPTGFALAGPDGTFHPAVAAVVNDNTLRISPENVRNARHVRYNWAANPTGTLVNSEGMPTGTSEARASRAEHKDDS
mgnify:CR=1 FL=1